MHIDFLYYEDCPSHDQALARLRQVMAEEGVDAPIAIHKMETEEQARAWNFVGSPTILIDGETGVGKDLLANYIHYSSPLSDQPFIQVNCSGLPRELIESELFGHEKGSFTGATQQKQGLFEVASSGTIFLDEVGDMPLDMQTKLLHVLENKRVRRVGGTREHDVNVRIIAATNQNLEGAIAANKFRSDLFYRLKVVHINLPPLRDRGRDRALLIEYFLERYMRKYRRPELKITKEVLNELLRYNWPGNVREMAHTIERLVLISEGNDLISPKFSSASGSDGGADRGPLSAVDLDEQRRRGRRRDGTRTPAARERAAIRQGLARGKRPARHPHQQRRRHGVPDRTHR